MGNVATRSTDSESVNDGEMDSSGSNAHLVGLKSSEKSILTSTAGQRVLSQLKADRPYMEFPVGVSDQNFLAFTIPGTEALLGALGFGLATPHQFLAPEIKSGALVVWLLSDPKIAATIPLAPPTLGKPASILDAMYDGITFKPHLSTELARPETASKIKWFAEPIGFSNLKSAAPESVEGTGDLWVVINSAHNMCLLRLNSQELQREIKETLPGNPKEPDEKFDTALQVLIDRTAPIQVEVRMDPPSYIDAKNEAMITRAKTILFMKGDDGSTCSLIFQHQPRPGEKTRKQEFENELKSALIRWLAVNLNLDTPLVDAMTKGKSFSVKSAASAEVRATSVFAQKLVQIILRELDEEFEFRAVRSTTLMSELGELAVPISAYQGDE